MMPFHLIRSTLVVGLLLAAAACTNSETAKHEYLESGNRFMAEGRTDEAILQYRNAIRHDNRFGEARWRLAEALEQQGNAAAAAREYVRAADLLPENVEVQVKAATYLLLSQQFEDARARAERALEHDPRNVEALILRANATAGLKDVPAAIQEIEEALELQPAEGRMYTSLGVLRMVGGREAEAEAAFRQAIEVDPSSVEARLALASFHWAGGREADVETVLNEALALDASHLMLNRMLTAFYLTTGRAAEAEAPLKVVAERAGDAMSSFVLADYYVQMQRPDEAVAILKPMAEGANPSGPAMLRLAQIERAAGRPDAARRMLDELIEREPRNAAALTTLSGWQRRDGETAAALGTARAAVDAAPDSAPAHFALGQAHIDNREPDEAIAALNETLRINPRIAAAQLLLSRLQLASGNPDAAVQLATDAKRTAPENPDVRLALARGLIAQGNLPQAEPEVRALLAQYPQAAASHVVNGMLMIARRDTAGARAAFTRALERDANSVEALQGLLVVDAASGNVSAALSRIEDRLASQPRSAPLLVVAARTYAAARQPDKAEKALRDAIDVDSGNLAAYFLLGQVLAAQNRLDEAVAEFDTAAARRPSQVGASTMAAILVQMQGKEAEAQKRYEAIVAATQRAPVAANNLAWIYAEKGTDLDAALTLAQSARIQLPNAAEVSDTLGWVYYKQNLPHLAIPLFQEAVTADPANASYHLRLGLAYARTGDHDRATESLQQALRLNLPPGEAEVAREALAAAR
jgi:tetratricopeptide (TPR) repeat protein